MDRIEAYNQILAYLGEEPISTIETSDYIVNLIASSFETIKKRILIEGFSFNSDKVTLTAGNDGKITVPSSWLKPPRFQLGNTAFTVRNGYVWDNQNSVYVGPSNGVSSVQVIATLDIAYEQIPNAFQDWIALEVAQATRIRMNGPDETVQYLEREKYRAKARAANSEPANGNLANGWSSIMGAYNQ